MLDVLFESRRLLLLLGGLGIGKLKFLIPKKFNFFLKRKFFQYCLSRPWIRIGVQPRKLDSDPDQMNADPQPCLKGKSDTAKIEQLQKQLTKDQETIKDLKSQLKKSNNEMKERSLLLEMYKTCTKEIRDKAQLMAAEKRARLVTEGFFSLQFSFFSFDYLGPLILSSFWVVSKMIPTIHVFISRGGWVAK